MAKPNIGHVFISYSRKDHNILWRIVQFLNKREIKTWVDNEKLAAGTPDWVKAIEGAIEASSAVIVVMSPDSKDSKWVRREIALAEQNQKQIFRVLVRGDNNSSITLTLRAHQYVDLRDNVEAGLISLHEALAPHLDIVPIKQPPKRSARSRVRMFGIAGFAIIAIGAGGYAINKNPQLLVLNPTPIQTVYTAVVTSEPEPRENAPPTEAEPSATSKPTESVPTITETLPSEITDSKGVEMVLVPKGEFRMGSESITSEDDEEPIHPVNLGDYYIDKFEVTNALYSACVNAGICKPPTHLDALVHSDYYENQRFADYPVVYVNWEMAQTYCEWRSSRLPTEAQWEKAARGTDERIYPWGNEISCQKANYHTGSKGCVNGPSIVGYFADGISPYGVYDLTGNVWEWVADWYSEVYYQTSLWSNPVGPVSGLAKVLRGGSWNRNRYEIIATNRNKFAPDYTNFDLGFRCAR